MLIALKLLIETDFDIFAFELAVVVKEDVAFFIMNVPMKMRPPFLNVEFCYFALLAFVLKSTSLRRVMTYPPRLWVPVRP